MFNEKSSTFRVPKDSEYNHGSKAVKVAAGLASKSEASLTIGHVLLHGEPPSAFRRMTEMEHLVRKISVKDPNEKNASIDLIASLTQAEIDRVSHDTMEALADHIVGHAVDMAKECGANDVSIRIEEGDTANRILKIAEDVGADLIVIGTRGFGPIKALLVGSVSQKITQLASCACLTVK